MISEAKLIRVLDKLSAGVSIKRAMASIHLNVSTYYDWITRAVEPFEWQNEVATFARHTKRARAMAIVSLDSEVRDEAEFGKPMYVGKDPVWQVDEKVAADALAMDDLEWALEYNSRSRSDIWARDENGKLIQARTMMPAALRGKVLQGLMPKVYGDHSQIEINSKLQISGAMTVGAPRVAAERAARAEALKLEAAKHLSDPARVTAPQGPTPMVGKPSDEPPTKELPPYDKRRPENQVPKPVPVVDLDSKPRVEGDTKLGSYLPLDGSRPFPGGHRVV
jgi:hypothetical protein